MNNLNIRLNREDFWQDVMGQTYPLEKVGANKYMSIQVIAFMADYNVIEGMTTAAAYNMYVHICKTRNIIPMKHITFSQFIVWNLNYWIQNKRHGKKCRVFRQNGYKPNKKAGV